MQNIECQKWNEIFKSEKLLGNDAAQVLVDNLHLLPQSGSALDLACGLGANAIQLAKHGLDTHAWDISDIALTKLRENTDNLRLRINIEHRDIISSPPIADSFDLIIVSHFLDRSIIKNIVNALRKNGLLLYQTFSLNKNNDVGPNNPNYLLQRNELLHLFLDLIIIYYSENDKMGNMDIGNRNEAMLIAQKG
jgi:tellurite methyltransferase